MCSLLVIWPETASDHLKSLLLKEIDAMKSLNPHSNVLQLLGYCVDEGWCSGIEAIDLMWLNYESDAISSLLIYPGNRKPSTITP